MKVFEATSHSCSIEASLISSERLYISKVSKKFSSIYQLKNKIEISWVLCESFEVNYERMIDLWMNKIFIVDVINLLCFHDFMFV